MIHGIIKAVWGDVMRVVVVGGGASGMVAAIYAAREQCQVTLIEKNKQLGKKLRITGNGKCNYWNADQRLMHYHSTNPEVLEEILTKQNQEMVLSFLSQLGIVPRIKNGYYYPYSNQATALQTAFLKELELQNVNIIHEEVKSITHQSEFHIQTDQRQLSADRLIIATGSYACPKTGSDGIGYQFARDFHHTIIKPLPALVQLRGMTSITKEWAGIRTDVSLKLLENGVCVGEEAGELQLTNYGVSGICVFQLSGQVARGLDAGYTEQLQINFLPQLPFASTDEWIIWMDERAKMLVKRTVSELLDSLLPYQLLNLLLKQAHIKRDRMWQSLSKKERVSLAQFLFAFPFTITGTNSFDQAQTCSGGIPLTEINPRTMESKKQPGLYFTGELLDVNGDCGGYNLSFAFLTGYLAGSAPRRKYD